MRLTELGFSSSPTSTPHFLAVHSDPSGPRVIRNNRLQDLTNWPRVVRVAFMVLDEERNVIDSGCEIIKQPRPLPSDGYFVHKVTDEQWKKEGVKPELFLGKIWEYSQQAEAFIGYEARFQSDLLEANMRRFKVTDQFGLPIKTIEEVAAYILQIPSGNPREPNKKPELLDIYNFLFPSSPLGFELEFCYDIIPVAVRCYFEMKKRGILS